MFLTLNHICPNRLDSNNPAPQESWFKGFPLLNKKKKNYIMGFEGRI